ncbi:extracellular solute-binding protein [Microbacterium sp. zg.Y625]|uniref:ABC transporter substrate-binding protein n=1 Tax=Microbacterium jiangjiandongii TaxID=3049071 RepID=UPI00214ADD2E|nr:MULTISPECIES: extracellular solute-binding protein [unclassified Microbacterium]MCR2792203.1 extracellular solute-binding protein [Microbacterium sp. zg.Y625]WIM25006.1 extracellular solute-binding protein [Microbacterium sp. zg-Y625]
MNANIHLIDGDGERMISQLPPMEATPLDIGAASSKGSDHMTSKFRAGRPVAVTALAALSAVALAACSSGGTGTGTTAGSSDDVVELSYIHRLPDGEGMTAVADIVERWNAENPGIQVSATKFDGAASDLILKLETDVKAGNGPCLAQVGYSEVPQLFVKGLLEDVAEHAGDYKDDFGAGAYAMMTVGDAVVGLPQDTGPLVYYYNQAELENLGLTVPTTIEELSASAAVAADAGKYLAAFTPDEGLNWLSAQSAAAGDAWFDTSGDAWSVDVEGAGSQRVAGFWQGLIDGQDALVTERWGEGFTQAVNNSTLIGHIGAAWEAGFMLDSLDGTPAEGQWRVAQLPDFGAGELSGPDGGSGVAVLSGCEHPAEAMAFNGWFNTQIDDLASQGLVVAANGTPETSEKMLRQFGGQDVLAELATASARMNPEFVYAPGFASLTTMNETASAVASGGATVADIFTTGQNDAVAALNDLGLPVAD